MSAHLSLRMRRGDSGRLDGLCRGSSRIRSTRAAMIALARENSICIIRADVAGRANGMVSYGSSGIVDPHGNVLQSAQRLTEGLIVADLEVSAPKAFSILM